MQTVNFYKIVSTNTYKVYVGSTVKTLSERMSGHIYDYNQFQEYKQHYVSSFDILDFKDYSIQLIETKDCKDIDECRTIERYHILNTPTAINIYQPGRTKEQYRQDHIEHYQQYQQQYREDHKENIKQYYRDHEQKLKEKHTCQCSGKYTTQNKTT